MQRKNDPYERKLEFGEGFFVDFLDFGFIHDGVMRTSRGCGRLFSFFFQIWMEATQLDFLSFFLFRLQRARHFFQFSFGLRNSRFSSNCVAIGCFSLVAASQLVGKNATKSDGFGHNPEAHSSSGPLCRRAPTNAVRGGTRPKT